MLRSELATTAFIDYKIEFGLASKQWLSFCVNVVQKKRNGNGSRMSMSVVLNWM